MQKGNSSLVDVDIYVVISCKWNSVNAGHTLEIIVVVVAVFNIIIVFFTLAENC